MARRRLTQEERKQETRQLLLEAASEIFAEHGFHGASVDKIAEFAGFSKGAVYAHFSSKEDLFLALLEQRFKTDIQIITESVGKINSSEEFIGRIIQINDQAERSRTWSILNLEFLLFSIRSSNEKIREKLSSLIMNSIQGVAKMVPEEKANSFLSAEELAWIILSLGNGMGVLSFATENQVPENLYERVLKRLSEPIEHNG